MADKEATVYIIDLGSTMGRCNSGRAETDLTWSMQYVWDKISTTVAASRKTWLVGVIGLRTADTKNPLDEQGCGGYENISVLHPLSVMTLSDLRSLNACIKVSTSQELGDAVSAIVVAVDMIETVTRRLKYRRKVVLITDAMAPIDGDNFSDITRKMADVGVDLVVLGVDFDDADYGYKQEDKPTVKAHNETLLRRLCHELCARTGVEDSGICGTVAEALDEMATPRLKPSRPYRSYEGALTLGDTSLEVHGVINAVTISVERYFKTHVAKPASASTVMQTGGFVPVHNARTYSVPDAQAPGGKRDVDPDSLARGYEYGSTAVHISESEHNITRLETTKSFAIVGFVDWKKFEPFIKMGECNQIVASRFSPAAQIAMSSLVHALYELENYAVARLVVKDGKEPQLVLLMPDPFASPECLYDVPLPFAEDVRTYRFPLLDRVLTVSGGTLTVHRNLPTEPLLQAMDSYMDSMDLMTFQRADDDDAGDDDNNTPSYLEYCTIEDTYNPLIHRLDQALRLRATQLEAPIPPASDVLLRFSRPPDELVRQAREEIDALISAADVKKVQQTQGSGRKGTAGGDGGSGGRGRGSGRRLETVKPLSGLDIDALLSMPPEQARPSATATGASDTNDSNGDAATVAGKRPGCLISRDNSVPEFKQALARTKTVDDIEAAACSMSEIIEALVRDSAGDANYDRATENLRVMRSQLVAIEEPEIYNAFVRRLKPKLLARRNDGNSDMDTEQEAAGLSLGGDRRKMWWKIREEKLGLVSMDECGVSEVGSKEAQEFLLESK